MKNYLLIIIAIFFIGCKNNISPKQDGLYINYKLVKPNATVEDFCKRGGELIRGNKVIFSKEEKWVIQK